jgi:endonuclease YncB( thermonuclease family)
MIMSAQDARGPEDRSALPKTHSRGMIQSMKTRTLPLAFLLLTAVAASADAKPPPKPAVETAAAKPATPEPPVASECAALGALPDNWSGVAYAIDGSTLAAVGLKPNLRLWGIRAPEVRNDTREETVSGMRARATLEDLLSKSDHKLKCRVTKFDRQCQAVAHCVLDAGADSIDLGGAMIASGMAYGFALDETMPWEPKASQRYADAEFDARKQRRGLWPVWLGEK